MTAKVFWRMAALLCGAFIWHCAVASPDGAFFKALKDGADTRLNLRVVDDRGVPVADARVQATLASKVSDYSLSGLTDSNGCFAVNGRTTGDYIVVVCKKDGHYDSRISQSFIKMGAEHSVRDGKWQPYGDEIELPIRKMRNPSPLVHCNETRDVPATNVWMGYDMKARDFTKPYGRGKVPDFEMRVIWDGKRPASSALCRAEIRFQSESSGGYYAKKHLYSKYPYPFSAESNASYEVTMVDVVNRDGDPHTTKKVFGSDVCLVLRSRCEVGDDGCVKSANYGNMMKFAISPSRRGVVTLTIEYVLNPVPNDTNLELKR